MINKLKKHKKHGNIDNKLETFRASVYEVCLFDFDKLLFVEATEYTDKEYEQLAIYLFQELYD